MEELALRREDITENVIAIKVNRSYREGMPSLALYEITRGYWKVNKKRAQQAEYAFCVYNGTVKEVYQILEWLPAGTVPRQTLPDAETPAGRYEFVGEAAAEEIRRKYVGRSIGGLYRNGEQNPFKYFYRE